MISSSVWMGKEYVSANFLNNESSPKNYGKNAIALIIFRRKTQSKQITFWFICFGNEIGVVKEQKGNTHVSKGFVLEATLYTTKL